MMSSPHGPDAWGDTHATMAGGSAARPGNGEPIAKAGLSADWGLQLAPMKAELLVTAWQLSAVNTYPGLVHTARHVMGVGNT